jgi:hypothetical protein
MKGEGHGVLAYKLVLNCMKFAVLPMNDFSKAELTQALTRNINVQLKSLYREVKDLARFGGFLRWYPPRRL